MLSKPIFKAMALLVALTLSLPYPAFALRAQQPTEDSKRTSGLEEALRTSPDATLQEIGRIAQSVLPTIPAVPAAGMEAASDDEKSKAAFAGVEELGAWSPEKSKSLGEDFYLEALERFRILGIEHSSHTGAS